MTERQMFEQSFKRPTNFMQLDLESQWDIDKSLGILDWEGKDLTDDDKKRYWKHYGMEVPK